MHARLPDRATALLALAASLAFLVPSTFISSTAHAQRFSESLLEPFEFRNPGPFRTGAWVTDFAVPAAPEREHRYTFYVGTRNGGVWKTVNNGTTFEPVFDDVGPQTIGAVAVAPSDADVVWVGTGESYLARYTYAGDGIYKSTDAGATWRHMALAETHHIARIIVHPTDPDIVYVAAMGHLHGPNPERGVFRTSDGGATWKKALYIDERVGVIDLVMDPSDPDVLYAATYEKERYPWTYVVGGPGSGIYRTTNGGQDWTRLTNGLPSGMIGRIGIDVHRADPRILYAVYENANARPGDPPGSMRVRGGWGEVYRSDDAGASWRQVSPPDLNVGGKAPYSFNMLRVDPVDPQRVYVTSDAMLVSEDGGRTWNAGRTLFRRMFGDIRTLWIDPDDPERIFVGSDGGVNISYDRGRTVDYLPNLPIGEIYDLTYDLEDPYHIYVGLQDHESWKGPINGFSGLVGGIESWVTVGMGDGMYQAVDPTDSRWVYNTWQFGGHYRVDQQTAERVRIQPPQRAEGDPYRYTWTTPIVLSPHDPSVVYTGAQVVLRSPDRGDTWVEISPDLTTNDPARINGHGNIQYCTITTVAESPLTRGVIWAGTDDGRVHVTRDDGARWTDVTEALAAAGAPDGYWVTRVVPSPHAPGTAFVTITGFHRDDFRPFVYRTDDYGATWLAIASSIPSERRPSANAIVQDRRNSDLLFLGTDGGLYVSIDGGARWVPFQNEIPDLLPVRDVEIHPRENDLIVGTHGRNAYVTDITPLQQLSDQVLAEPFHLFEPEPKGLRIESAWGNYRLFGYRHITTPNEPNGVLLDVYRRDAGDVPITLRITDPSGATVRTLQADAASAGIHRIVWNLRNDERDPVAPGAYTLTLEAGATRQTRTMIVKPAVVLPR